MQVALFVEAKATNGCFSTWMGDHLVLPSISECMHERKNIAIYDKQVFSKNESIVSNHTHVY